MTPNLPDHQESIDGSVVVSLRPRVLRILELSPLRLSDLLQLTLHMALSNPDPELPAQLREWMDEDGLPDDSPPSDPVPASGASLQVESATEALGKTMLSVVTPLERDDIAARQGRVRHRGLTAIADLLRLRALGDRIVVIHAGGELIVIDDGDAACQSGARDGFFDVTTCTENVRRFVNKNSTTPWDDGSVCHSRRASLVSGRRRTRAGDLNRIPTLRISSPGHDGSSTRHGQDWNPSWSL